MSEAKSETPSVGTLAPLRSPVFRNIWIASLLSNIGFMIQSVGASWAMASIAGPAFVALVQTATFLPLALLTLPAGAIADTFDRRKTQLVALLISMIGASSLLALSLTDLLTPWALLGVCFWIGCGMALFGPAWQASVAEQVDSNALAQAITLNGSSFNLARSVGPALGGVIIGSLGVAYTFATNALFYLPMFFALLLWKRKVEPARIAPERFFAAIGAGVRYIIHTHPARSIIGRMFVLGLACTSIIILMPLIARDHLQGDASVFGFLLTSFGAGSVAASFLFNRIRRFDNEWVVRGSSVVMALAMLVIALAPVVSIVIVSVFVAGMTWMLIVMTASVSLQLLVPRWVMGRAVALNTAAISLGASVGGWGWGQLAAAAGTPQTLIWGAVSILAALLISPYFRIYNRENSAEEAALYLNDPSVKMDLTGRSGPIAIQVEYRISLDDAREFYNVMQAMRRFRCRNGAHDWSLSRDIGEPENWCEQYRVSTWDDYLRLRSRGTVEEAHVLEHARNLHSSLDPIRVRHFLERPVGSVRWQENTPDRGDIEVLTPQN